MRHNEVKAKEAHAQQEVITTGKGGGDEFRWTTPRW